MISAGFVLQKRHGAAAALGDLRLTVPFSQGSAEGG